MRLDAGTVGGYCHDLEAAAYEYDDDDDEAPASPSFTDRGYDSFLHGQLSDAEAREDDDEAVFAQCSAELQEYRRVAGRYQAQLRVRATSSSSLTLAVHRRRCFACRVDALWGEKPGDSQLERPRDSPQRCVCVCVCVRA